MSLGLDRGVRLPTTEYVCIWRGIDHLKVFERRELIDGNLVPLMVVDYS
jgi:hypothetical protein